MSDQTVQAVDSGIMRHFVLREPREKQIKAMEYLQRKYNEGFRDIVISAPTGCHGAGQRVIMMDGSLKKVEEVKVGDLLMGPDSNSRRVLALIRGRGPLFRIDPKNGLAFTVNDQHVLSLQRTNDGWGKSYEKLNIILADYLTRSRTFKHIHKLWRPKKIRFRKLRNSLLIKPYFLGLWLGDGTSSKAGLTTADREIEVVWKQFVEWHGLKTRTENFKDSPKTKAHYATTGHFGGHPKTRRKNWLLQHLRLLGVLNCKHIPRQYKVSSISQRLELLAGLMDTDGSLTGGCYDFSSVSEGLAKDVTFIARSCGFSATCSSCQKSCQTGAIGTYWRVCISGDICRIPCLIGRKKAGERKQKKSVLRTGFSVTSIGIGDFYGFTLTSDQLYLLEDFTVTHNSGKSALAASACFWAAADIALDEEKFDKGGYVLVNQKLLQDQYAHDFKNYVVRDPLISCQSIKSSTEYQCPKHGTCAFGMNPKAKCPLIFNAQCRYKRQKGRWVNATMSVTNYSYLFTEHTLAIQLKPRGVVVMDEAHGLERQILKFIEVSVTDESLRRWARKIQYVPNFEDVEDFAEFLVDEYLPIIQRRLDALKDWEPVDDSPEEKKIAQEKLDLENHWGRTYRGASLILDHPENWVFYQEKNRHGDNEAYAKPIDAAPFAQELVFEMGHVRLYLSAYPGSKAVFCRSLGLEPEKVAWLNLNSTFPIENRKIYLSMVGSMSRRNRSQTMPRFLSLTEKIMDMYSESKGIIHVNSYEIGEAVFKMLKEGKHSERLLFPQSSDERDPMFKRHKILDEPTVIISPSMGEGFDFANDLARWQIIAKIPFLYLGDRQVLAKKEIDAEWYDLEAVKAIIQACGRIVRSDSDKGDTYILDSDFIQLWERCAHFFPKWWTEGLVWPERQR